MTKEKHNKINRRNFLKTIGAAGLAPAFTKVSSAFASAKTKAGPNEPNAPEKSQKPKLPQVPRRKLGKTGVEVPSLSLGTVFNAVKNQAILRESLKWGVNFWDTANEYEKGNSELGIGKFLLENPEVRKKLFLATKASGAKTVADVEKLLQTSLKRMNTTYIDLYYGVHGLTDPAQLTDELKQWAKNAKKRGLIRFFGFATHNNMEGLAAAAKLDWIDAIMLIYNFRVMQDAKLAAAIEACHKAGIGLIAIKTQGLGPVEKIETEEDKKLTEHFLRRGLTEGQAKVKVVLEDKRFSSACVGRENVAHLKLNVDAVLDKTKLSKTDTEVFTEYARATCSGYCACCSYICNSALRNTVRHPAEESIGLPDVPYVSDIMRYLMYYNSYGKQDMARELFAQIPREVRDKLLGIDYSVAEARCPQHLPIGKLVAEAVSKLA